MTQKFIDLGEAFENKYYNDKPEEFIDDINNFFDYNIEKYVGQTEEITRERKKQLQHLKRYFKELLEVYYYDDERIFESLHNRENEILPRIVTQFPVLKTVINPLLKEVNYSIFVLPVDTSYYINYTNIVKDPICLQDIRTKIDNKEYKTYGDFVMDLYRVFDNAMKFDEISKNDVYY